MIKIFNVDWDSPREVSSLLHKLKGRRGELLQTRSRKKQTAADMFLACKAIFDANITHLYDGLLLDNTPKYYVYAHMNSAKKICVDVNGKTTFAATLGVTHFPVYIGKGVGERCFVLARNEIHKKLRQSLNNVGKELLIIKIAEGLSEVEALCLESKLIDIFGILPYGGMLSNLNEGHRPEKRRQCYRLEFGLMNRRNSTWKQVV